MQTLLIEAEKLVTASLSGNINALETSNELIVIQTCLVTYYFIYMSSIGSSN
jgi:hypothetical protein